MKNEHGSLAVKLRHLAEFLPARTLGYLLSLFPRRTRWMAGRWVGGLFFALDARHRAVTLNNLDIAFRDTKTAEEKRAIARQSFRHFGAMLFEMLSIGKVSRETIERLVVFEGVEHYESARAKGRGVIVIGAHFGNWEMNAIAHGFRFARFFPVARALDNPYFNRWLERIRNLPGNEVVYKRRAVPRLMRLLKDRETVGLVIDQNVSQEDAVFIDFFGCKAATTPVAGLLALKTGAVVVPMLAFPLPDGRYRSVYDKPIDPLAFDGRDRQHAVREITQYCADVLEDHVRRNPQYWLWMHRRWKTRPVEEADEDPAAAGFGDLSRHPPQSSNMKAGSS